MTVKVKLNDVPGDTMEVAEARGLVTYIEFITSLIRINHKIISKFNQYGTHTHIMNLYSCNHKGLRILISNHGAQRPDQEFGIHHRSLFELAALTGLLTLLDQSVHKGKVGNEPPAEL